MIEKLLPEAAFEAEDALLDSFEALKERMRDTGLAWNDSAHPLDGNGGPAPRNLASQNQPNGGKEQNGGCKPEQAFPADKLTRRELEVLKHIAEGHSTKEVAAILGISFKTAACHRYRAMEKLGIHETANLVRFAVRQGMILA